MSGLLLVSDWDAFWFVCRIWPSQLSCLGSSVGKSITWKADGHGFESHPKQPIFLLKMTVLGELCCVALPFCCVVVALPLSASLGVVVHATVLTTFCIKITIMFWMVVLTNRCGDLSIFQDTIRLLVNTLSHRENHIHNPMHCTVRLC